MTDAAATDTDGAAGAQASDGTGASDVNPSDYKARIEAGGSFAWEQNQLHQSRADKSQGAEGKYEELVKKVGERTMAYIEKYGGDTVATATGNYELWRGRETQDVVDAFERTGQLPERKGSESKEEDEDEYVTAEERELKTLKSEVAQVRARQSAASLSTGQAAVKRHMEAVSRELDLEDKDFEKMRDGVVAQMEALRRQGDVGERALDALASENGLSQVRGLMLQQVDADTLHRAAVRRNLRKRGKLDELTTEGPGRVSSAGKEPPPKFKSYIEAAKWAENNQGAHDSY